MNVPFYFNKPRVCDLRVCDNLVRLRKLKGISQKDLANLCGVSQNVISNIETGKSLPSLSLVVQICLALNCYFFCLVEVYDCCAEENIIL